MEDLASKLDKLNEKNLFRRRRLLSSAQEIEPVVDGKKVLSFCSNDYLGLANHEKVKQAYITAIKKYGIGTGASHLVTGHHECHAALEKELAEFLGCEKVLLFSTGYMANLGVVSTLASRDSVIFADKLNHASLNDAAIQSRASLKRYVHQDLIHLKKLLHSCDQKSRLILSDGVFSMDGTIAPISQLQDIAAKNQSQLIIDDAHGIGVLGNHGKGSTEGILNDKTILVGTLGKAFGTFGAFVAAKQETIQWLIQRAHSYIYTTAAPPAIAEATRMSLRIIQKESWRREKLQELVNYFRKACEQMSIKLTNSQTPIQPIIVGPANISMKLSNSLLEKNILVPAIRPPTVPEGTARLRATFCANHTKQHIDKLIEVLSQQNLNG